MSGITQQAAMKDQAYLVVGVLKILTVSQS
jgi:hypothetical protein